MSKINISKNWINKNELYFYILIYLCLKEGRIFYNFPNFYKWFSYADLDRVLMFNIYNYKKKVQVENYFTYYLKLLLLCLEI